jgi:hypothetical protein
MLKSFEVWKNLKLPIIAIIALFIFIGCSDKDEPQEPEFPKPITFNSVGQGNNPYHPTNELAKQNIVIKNFTD